MFQDRHQEPSVIVVLVRADVHALLALRSRFSIQGHEPGRSDRKGKEVFNAPLTGRLKEPLLTGLFGKIETAVLRLETLHARPGTGNAARIALFVTARTDIKAPHRESDTLGIAVFTLLHTEEPVGNLILFRIGPIQPHMLDSPGVRSAETVHRLVGFRRIHAVNDSRTAGIIVLGCCGRTAGQKKQDWDITFHGM